MIFFSTLLCLIHIKKVRKLWNGQLWNIEYLSHGITTKDQEIWKFAPLLQVLLSSFLLNQFVGNNKDNEDRDRRKSEDISQGNILLL